HTDRKQLVGLLASEVLEEGAQLVADDTAPALGHVTSAYWSETLMRPIALALLSGGHARIGEVLYVPMADRTIAVRVTDPVTYDSKGARLHGGARPPARRINRRFAGLLRRAAHCVATNNATDHPRRRDHACRHGDDRS